MTPMVVKKPSPYAKPRLSNDTATELSVLALGGCIRIQLLGGIIVASTTYLLSVWAADLLMTSIQL